jgi:pimeloyl-ACP methyl ester carboxylesterase
MRLLPKKRIQNLLIVILIIGSHGRARAAETEPNNTRPQANALLLNASGQATNSGRINPISDLDFFSVTTPSFVGGGTIVIKMTPTSSDRGLDAWLQLQNTNGTLLAEKDMGFDDTAETLTFTQAVANTTYFIVCRSADFSAAGSGDYTLQAGVDNDPNDQLSEAPDLGAADRTLTTTGTIDSASDVDVFAFSTVAGQRISFDIDQTAGLDSSIRLFNTNGVELRANNDAGGPGEIGGSNSYLEYTFTDGGTYFLGVSGFSNTNYNVLTGQADALGSTGDYTLVVSPGLAGTIRRTGDSADYLVDIISFGVNPMAIDTNQRTWIVIHGWNSSRTSDNIFAVANALFQSRLEDQVLTLDWSAAADTGIFDPFSAESSIVPVAQWAASALVGYGFSGTNLNLVGHSFGSYVADEMAQRIPGGVNTIVTLDPAVDVTGGYDPTAAGEVDFARDSFFSWSFHSSSLGNEYTPATADESFIVNSDANAISAHGNVVFLFAYMLLHPEDMVGRFFLLNLLVNGTLGPWLPNQFAPTFAGDDPVQEYEAIINTTDNGRMPDELIYVPLPRLSIARTTNGVSISWNSFYTNFVLQTSPSANGSASWTNVSIRPVSVGATNVVVLPAAEAQRFFRLKW